MRKQGLSALFFVRIGQVRMVYYAVIDSREKERIHHEP